MGVNEREALVADRCSANWPILRQPHGQKRGDLEMNCLQARPGLG
jgi:hypothetical protein